MAETDILNPTTGWWASINDNPNPSYGTPRRTANNNALAKTRLGAPYTRETMNQGFGFEFYFIDRPWTTVLRLQNFYQQFKGGYFTYIDYDGGGRHHVGRFTSSPNPMQTANNKYTLQGLVFEEVPRARMLQYPADFANWSRTINVLDDFLSVTVASYGASAGAWITHLNPALSAPSATDPTAYELFDATPAYYTVTPNNCDWAQIQYVGWGLQMTFRSDPSLGQVAIAIDGAYICTLDLSTGAWVPPFTGATLPAGVTVIGGVLTATNMPLDMHRVRITAYQPGASGGTAVIFPAVKVIV